MTKKNVFLAYFIFIKNWFHDDQMLLNSPADKVNLGVKQLLTIKAIMSRLSHEGELVLLYGIFFLLVTKKEKNIRGN